MRLRFEQRDTLIDQLAAPSPSQSIFSSSRSLSMSSPVSCFQHTAMRCRSPSLTSIHLEVVAWPVQPATTQNEWDAMGSSVMSRSLCRRSCARIAA